MPETLRLTRRSVLLLASGYGAVCRLPLLASSSDFWNKKEPSEWSSEEIDHLATKSPWAKEVTASSPQMSRGYDSGGSGRGGNTGGMGDPGIGGGGTGYPGGGYPGGGMGGGGRGMGYPGGGMGGGRRGGGRSEVPLQYKGIVRWESAKPIQEALKTPLGAELASSYVISVSGIPVLTPGRQHSDDGDTDTAVSKGLSDDVLERIKNLTYLEPKGKSAAQPSVVQKGPVTNNGSTTILFGFPREAVQLSADDREVMFTTQFGKLEIKTKFNLKDMMYHNVLAL